MTEDFTAALNQKLPLKELLKNDDWERLFRAGLRSKDEQLIKYLSSDEVLADMIECLVNEEERSLQDASEVLGVLLTNLDAVNDALAAKHLPALFLYLDRKTMNPRRMYFFLRLSSFLFQNRTKEALTFAINCEGFTARIIKHLGSPHILQLVLLILNLERQIKNEDPSLDWSGKTGLVGCLVKMLQDDPSNTLEPVFKFLQEICTHNDPTSDFIKSTISANNGALTTCLVKLTKEKSIAQDAIRVLDEFVLKVLMLNKHDEVFFKAVSTQLSQEREVFEDMLASQSLMHVLSGVKFLNALTKHKAFFLLGNGLNICLDIMFRFPWSNILHNAIVIVIGTALQDENEEFVENLLDSGFIKLIVKGLANPEPTGCKPHLRQLAATLQMTRSPKALEKLATDPLWEKYWSVMELRKNPDVTFVDAEKSIVLKLQQCLKECEEGGGFEVPEVVSKEDEDEIAWTIAPKIAEEEKKAGDEIKSDVPQIPVDEAPKEVAAEKPVEETPKVAADEKTPVAAVPVDTPKETAPEPEKQEKVEEPKAEEKKAEEPKTEETKPKEEKPKEEKPKAEEPKTEEPKAEKPKVEEPKAEEPTKTAEEPKTEEPKAEKPKAEEPKVEEPTKTAEEPKVEETKKEDGESKNAEVEKTTPPVEEKTS